MATIKVRPADGARVVQPGPGGMPIPADGIEVPDTAYYRRLILTGDLIDLGAAGDAPAPAAAEVTSPAQAPETGGRRTTRAQQE